MNGLVRTVFGSSVGAVLFYALPRAGVMAATQELIGFLALLMAGLLPAMTLTATILRGEGISARRVEEYAGALRAQLRFWAVLFGAATISTGAISLAKVFSTKGAEFVLSWWRFSITQDAVVGLSLIVAGAGFGLILRRLYAAYEGLQSLLTLNVAMAKSEAISRDRAIRDAIALDMEGIKNPPEYASKDAV